MGAGRILLLVCLMLAGIAGTVPLSAQTPIKPAVTWTGADKSNFVSASRPASHTIDSVVLHTVEGTAASRSDLGIAVQSSLYLGATELAGWRALPLEETRRLGLEQKAGGSLVAGLTTEVTAPRVDIELARRNTRGEYRAVTHVLAAERAFGRQGQQNTVRVRCDLRLAVVFSLCLVGAGAAMVAGLRMLPPPRGRA